MLGYDWPRLHAALNDLPTALLLTAVLFDLAGLSARRPFLRQAGFYTMLVGAVGAVAAVIAGLQAEEHIAHGEAVHEVMEVHEKLALFTTGVFAIVVLWRLLRERKMGNAERAISTAVSLVGVGLLFATGIYGGKLMFDHAAGVPTAVLQEELHERSEGHHHHGEEGAEPAGHSDSAGVEADDDHDHLDPPGTPPHTHSHAPGTPPHKD
jgi:uncharacterized membrane protein